MTDRSKVGRDFEEAKTDFGSGLVTCLVKLAVHFDNDMARMVRRAHHWNETLKRDDKLLHDYDQSYHKDIDLFKACYMRGERTFDEALSQVIEMWIYGLADHFEDMQVPDKASLFVMKAVDLEKKLDELREMCDTFSVPEKIWTFDDFKTIQQLVFELAMSLDIGIGLEPDIGKYR